MIKGEHSLVLNPTLSELINAVAALQEMVEERDSRIEELEREVNNGKTEKDTAGTRKELV